MSTESEPICSHMADTLADEDNRKGVLDKFRRAITWYANKYQVARSPHKRRKLASPTCRSCDLPLFRPYVCLHCDYTGCWSDSHVLDHLRDEGHLFCADAKSGCVYCSECDNFIYDATLCSIHESTTLSAEEKHSRFQVLNKRREPFQPWVPGEKDLAALEGAQSVPCQAGMRGLLNLGQTCFLNVVLQCFVHNPLLRNYFLGDKHNWRQCKTDNCTCCEMDKLFTEIYSHDNTAFGPHTFLATTWRASAELAGYAQQDAHEFFISALNQIHTTSRGSTEVSCNCIIHSTFAGHLQSDVKCERCGNVTTTNDPMLDISLELKGSGDISDGNSLVACLRRYTQSEKLGSKEYSCVKCGKASHVRNIRTTRPKGSALTGSKQTVEHSEITPGIEFSIQGKFSCRPPGQRELSRVSYMKRFEHKASDKSAARKIETKIRFPAALNMAPYTTLYMNEAEKDKSGLPLSFAGPDSIYEYDLFAVINHEGQMNNGHYTNFARCGDEWYRFDDDKVTHTTLGACLKSTAYMCFYVKRHLDYKPNMTPSYVRAREAELAKEKEREAAKGKEIDDDILATV